MNTYQYDGKRWGMACEWTMDALKESTRRYQGAFWNQVTLDS
jgi:hypothetical protein